MPFHTAELTLAHLPSQKQIVYETATHAATSYASQQQCLCSDRYDQLSYARERQEIRELMQHRKSDMPIDCSDFIAVGPNGDIPFSRQQWQRAQAQE